MIHQVREIWSRIREASAWTAAREPVVLAVAVPILVISPSSAIPRWLEFAAAALVALPWFARRVAWGNWTKRTPFDPMLLLLFALSLAGASITTDPAMSWIALKCTVLRLGLFYAVVNHARSGRALNVVTVFILLAGLTAGALGALGSKAFAGRLFAFGPSVPLGIADIPALNPLGFNKNIWGGTVAMVIPLSLSLCFAGPVWRRISYGVLTVLLTALCVLSQSRGALLATGLGIWTVLLLRSRWVLTTLPVVIAGAVLVARQWGAARIAELFLSSEALGGWSSRVEVWSRALYMIQDFPFTGIGLGTFSRVAPVMYPFFLISPDTVVPHAHQLFLQMAVDLGLLGLVAFASALFLLAFVSWRTSHRSEGTSWKPLAHGLVGVFVVYLVHGCFDYITFSTKSASVVWMAMGLMLALWAYLRSADTATVEATRLRADQSE